MTDTAPIEDLFLDLANRGIIDVTADGEVYRLMLFHSKEQVYKPCPRKRIDEPAVGGRYRRVHLCIKQKMRSCYVHRLVYRCFIGPIPEGIEINHKNRWRSDNRLENLECLTPAKNIAYAIEGGALTRADNGRWLSGFTDPFLEEPCAS